MDNFSELVLQEVMVNKDNHHTDNYDPMMIYDGRFQSAISKKSLLSRFYQLFLPLAHAEVAHRSLRDILNPLQFYRRVVDGYHHFSYLYTLLADDVSKRLFIKLIAYKILGYQKVKLPRNNAKYWNDIEQIKKLDNGKGALQIKFADLQLGLHDLSPIGFNLKVNVTPVGAATIFTQKQYEYHHGEINISPKQGDVVIDCGACWGETVLYFAHEVGQDGRVYAFEFIPANLEIFNANIKQNAHLSERIELVNHPVWDKSDESLFYSDNGPGSSVSASVRSNTDTQCITTMSIDDLVERRQLNKVDFIKMDIEGAEMNALRGAEKTIRRDKPTLAISVYHKEDDFITIPTFINELRLDYEFYLDHHTIHYWETVLFAVPKH